MPKITYIEHDGTVHTVEAEIGATVMETALKGGVTGIVAECGGSCTCATCMVYVDEAWIEKVGKRNDEEEDQLDFAFDVKPNSRPLLPDQGDRGPRRPYRAHAGVSGEVRRCARATGTDRHRSSWRARSVSPTSGSYDCTTYLEPTPAGSDDPYIAVSGRRTFEDAHIPGADFLDLQGEFSDATTRLRFMMPATAQLEAAFGRHGLGQGSRVVLYSIGSMMWATRFWWMLRALGFDRAAVLDGGFDKWKAEGRPTESGPAKGYAPTTFSAKPRPGLFVGREAVLGALGRSGTVIVNALGPQFHKGLEPSRYGRPGRIPGSVNVPAASLVNPATKGLHHARGRRGEASRRRA